MGDETAAASTELNKQPQQEISSEELKEVPPAPASPPPPPGPEDKPVMNPIYNATSPTATILFIRQTELLGSPGMNMHTDVFSSVSVQLSSRVDTSDPSIWPGIVEDTNNDYIRSGKVKHVESAILEGIPKSLRGIVYLKTAQVKTHIDKTSYTSLAKRAKTSLSKEDQALLESENVSEDLKELLSVFTFCAREVVPEASAESVPNNFVLRVAPLVAAIPGLSKQEILALLFKFDSLNSRLHRDEFYYKLSRTLEESLPELFEHIAKQGIELTEVYKSILHNIFDVIPDQELLAKIFDFWLFEGFDFHHRLIGALFKEQEETIKKLSGDDLNDFFFSQDLTKALSESTVEQALEVEPSLIKFENEFHLMSANAMSGNYNELSNLKEASDDLNFKIKEMRSKIDSLKKTQDEISGQETDYTTQLKEAKQKRQELQEKTKRLQDRYSHLTMKENLHNTIKANEDISRQNFELVEQITALERSLAAKRIKLGNVQGPVDKQNEKVAEQANDKPSTKATEKPAETAENPIEEPTDSAETPAEKPAEKTNE
ncbi:hypothetical protein FT663_02987 [Candidozyma haemuli var. vulneris]|uniref:Rab-GAP TBC domain-containing protein n=1 Tax=Candidozyma haemuli TaxID=45357 RepID=A0A2V1AMY6_9ASCO|nr:hypothetical protein CXQ85_001519 [[Candida] haemuloni]KAF3990914.1 hypothetical protein FT663_02987 [[Candida] haemuloni var. vulneris]KAF3992746.1 hypothetical protein FT662_00955 [[Candida] haemuloni var. vulneris]PVH19218.1 hypothetical protein CXQ85_001519 [[Candida] haemuloni]